MKKFLLLSLLALSSATSIKCNFFSIFQSSTQNRLVYSTQREVYDAFIHLAGRNISTTAKQELWEEAGRAHTQIQKNMKDLGDAFSQQLIAQTIFEFFLMHIKAKIEIEATINHLPKDVAHAFYAEQTARIGQLSPKPEVTSPYDLPYGVFAPLFGNNLETRMERVAAEYHRRKQHSQKISWFDILIAGGLLILEALSEQPSSTPAPQPYQPPAPPREYHYENPNYAPPVAQPVNWEEGGLQKVRPDDCSLMCYEDASPQRHRIFCPFCGKPACRPCWEGNMQYGRYCGQGCFDSSVYSLESRNFWKKRIKEVLNNATTYCALCNKRAQGMVKLRNCAHQMCGMCQAMWSSLDGDYSEYCPRCTTPLH